MQKLKRAITVGVTASTIMALPAASALAADMPVKAPPPAQVVATTPYNWTGIYFGGHVGHGWGKSQTTSVNGTAAFPAGTSNETDLSGWIGGGQVGLNYQIDRLVLGIESEFSWSGIDGNRSRFSDVPAFSANRFQTSESKIKSFVTVAGRAGVTAGNWLLFAKGGVVWGKFDVHTRTVDPTAGNTLVAESVGGETRTGWLAGGGAEWGFAPNWSAKVEYNYLDFGTERLQRQRLVGPGDDPVTDAKAHVHVVKFGINYRFSWASPVVARY
jgi:outer membrane immunogenic protein